MKNRTILAIAFIALIALLPVDTRAGAWTQAEGEAYVRISGGFLRTDERFDRDGNKIATADSDALSAENDSLSKDTLVDLLLALRTEPILKKCLHSLTGWPNNPGHKP